MAASATLESPARAVGDATQRSAINDAKARRVMFIKILPRFQLSALGYRLRKLRAAS
jgi:hypothetical protein